MSQILTNTEIEEVWVEHGLNECGCNRFARAIESAIINKLNSAEPVFQVWRSTDGFNEFYAWLDCERSEFDNSPERDRRSLYPAPSASSRHFKQMESQLAQLTAERDSLKAPLDAVAKVASDAEKLVISQRDEIAKLGADRDSLKSALEGLVKVAPTEVSCNNMSHPRKYQHAYDETCELVSMYAEALLTAQEALKGSK